jgi:hypothetical protein
MRFLIFIGLFVFTFELSAQAPDSPVEYMEYLNNREKQLSQKYLSYMSEVAHGNRARKLEKRRQELLTAIKQSLSDATKLRPYKGDASLRDVYKNYWDILLKVFNEDYHKIVDMEEIAEQSYDNMEAYLLAQEKAGDVLGEASDKLEPAYNSFAANNNVRLVDKGDSKMEVRLRKVANVNKYYHDVFLVFFKSYKQDAYVWDAYNREDVNGLEQNRGSLIKVSDEATAKLDTIRAFNGDPSLRDVVRKVVEFHKLECRNYLPALTDYLVKKSDFQKIQKAFEAKAESKRTQADVDNYNKAVNDFNAAVNTSNKMLAEANAGGAKTLQRWEDVRKDFMERHIPKGK